MKHLSVEGDLVWKRQTRKFSPTAYSFKPILGLTDELTIASFTGEEVTATEVRTLSLLCSHTQDHDSPPQQSIL